MWTLYVLLCEDNSLYTGISKNVDKRFLLHQKGTASKYTQAHKPTKIVYLEKLPTRSKALKREWEIKSMRRKEKIALFED